MTFKGKYQLEGGMDITADFHHILMVFRRLLLWVYGVSKQMAFLVSLYLVISEKVLQ